MPPYMRASVAFGWQRRWSAMLSVAAASAFAKSLVLPQYRSGSDLVDGPELELSELFAGRGVGDGVFCDSPSCLPDGALVPGVGGLVPGEGGCGTETCEKAACERTGEWGTSERGGEAAVTAVGDDALGNGALAAALGGAPTQAGAT